MSRPPTRALLEVAAGMLLCLLLATIWDLAAVRLYGHRGTDKPLLISLGLSLVAQGACALLLWRRWHRIAIGFAIYIAGEAAWIALALTIFHRS